MFPIQLTVISMMDHWDICCLLHCVYVVCCLLQAVDVEVDMPAAERGYSDVSWSVAEKLSRAVKSECDGLNTEHTLSSDAVSVRCTDSSDDLMSTGMGSTVRVKQEPGLSCQDQQTELAPSYESQRGIWRRAECDDDVLYGVKVKQEPDTSNTYHTPVTGECSMYHIPVTGENEPVTSSVYHTPVTGECNMYHTLVTGEGELSSLSTELASAVPDTDLKVETCANRMPLNGVNGHCDNLSATAAAAAAAAATAAAADDDVNATSSESLTCYSEASQLTVATDSVTSCVCDSHALSPADSDTLLSVPQELVRCRDTFGKTYYIPRSLLLQVQSSSAVSCTKSTTDCSSLSNCPVLSAAHSTSRMPVTSGSRTSHGKHDDVSPCVCNVDTGTSTKSVVSSNTDGHITSDINDGHVTTDTNVCRVLVTATAISSSYSVTLSNAVSSAAVITVTVPSSVESTSTLSCSSRSSAPSTRQVHQVCLTSNKQRDQVRMASLPSSMLNNAVIKPRLLVPFFSVSSPARSLPHVTVLPTSSSVLTTSCNTTPVCSVVRTPKPSHTSAKLPASCNSPVYVVIGGNNKVVSGSSRAVMEVMLVPGTKDMTSTVMCSTQSVTAAVLKNRCISTVSAGLTRCNEVVRAASAQSVVCVPSLYKVSKPAQSSRSSSQISVLRPQNLPSSTTVTKPSSVELRAQIKRTPSSSSLNVFATKIGNQTVIVDVGNLSSSNSVAAAAKLPSVTAVTFPSSVKSKDVLVSMSTSTQQDTTSLSGNVVLQSSAPCVDSTSTVATDEVSENCAPVIRYINCFMFLC